MSGTGKSTHWAVLRIAQSHPALAGHFPGRPLVPGVVLLDCVLEAAERWLGRPVVVRALPVVKFMGTWLPEQDASLRLQALAGELRFEVLRGDTPIAQGRFELHPGQAG